MAEQLQLSNVVNPGNDDEMVVTRDSAPVNVGSGGEILDGDIINAASGASGDVVIWDTQANEATATVVTFEGAVPVTVEVNWDEVVQVDEYYNGTATQFDIDLLLDEGDTQIGIVG